MAISIPDTLPSQPAVSLPEPDATPSPAEATTDTVKLSEDARIRLLTQQGQSPDEIAQNLGVAVSTIEGYLGVVIASVVPAPYVPEPRRGGSPVTLIPSRG
jgi:DNA-binding CsgD family transcriptional regulator